MVNLDKTPQLNVSNPLLGEKTKEPLKRVPIIDGIGFETNLEGEGLQTTTSSKELCSGTRTTLVNIKDSDWHINIKRLRLHSEQNSRGHSRSMRISLIVAVSINCVIGRNNALVWRIAEDLARFKALTMGHALIMGRKSFESIGRLLDGRRSVVLTRNSDYNPTRLYQQADLHMAHSPKEAIRIASGLVSDEAFIIGGEQIYRLFLPSADRIYMTRVHRNFRGDTFFPELGQVWQVKKREDHLNARPYPYSFLVYERML